MIEKKMIQDTIFQKDYPADTFAVPFSDLPVGEMLPTDLIVLQQDSGYWSENESWDAFSRLVIVREREETDEEYLKRLDRDEKDRENHKRMRYNSYLKLKAEFESE